MNLNNEPAEDIIYPTQDPKYGIRNNRLVNMVTGKPIPEDEPVFLFRAKDVNAEGTIKKYLSLCLNTGHREAIASRLKQFIGFKQSNPELMKEPDTANQIDSQAVEEAEGCNKQCWREFHQTGGYHRTDCSLSLAAMHQVNHFDKKDLEHAQKLVKSFRETF